MEPETLEQQVDHAEQEARMVLPGIHALFGFQLIAVFNASFFERFAETDRRLHFLALICTALSALLIMTPAAYHRQAEQGCVSHRFVRIASCAICAAMLLLGVSVSTDIDIIGRHILGSDALARAIAVLLFATYIGAWFVFPQIAKRRGRGTIGASSEARTSRA